MLTAELLVHKRGSFGDKIAIEKLKRYKTHGIDQIPAELIQVASNALRYVTVTATALE
jgi:hypothetical protein